MMCSKDEDQNPVPISWQCPAETLWIYLEDALLFLRVEQNTGFPRNSFCKTWIDPRSFSACISQSL